MFEAYRVDEYNITITAKAGHEEELRCFVADLCETGLKAQKLTDLVYQVSFVDHPETSVLFLEVGRRWKIGPPYDRFPPPQLVNRW